MWVRVPGPVNELQQEESVHVAGGFGPDGLRPHLSTSGRTPMISEYNTHLSRYQH